MVNQTIRGSGLRSGEIRNKSLRVPRSGFQHHFKLGIGVCLFLAQFGLSLVGSDLAQASPTFTGSPLNLALPGDDDYDWGTYIRDNFRVLNTSWSLSVGSALIASGTGYVETSGDSMTGRLTTPDITLTYGFISATATITGASSFDGTMTVNSSVTIAGASSKVKVDSNTHTESLSVTSGAVVHADLTVIGNVGSTRFLGPLRGNSDTTTALAANGADCPAGSFPIGVDASGAAESCTDAATQAELDTHTSATGSSAHGATADESNSNIVTRDSNGSARFTRLSASNSMSASSFTARATTEPGVYAASMSYAGTARADLGQFKQITATYTGTGFALGLSSSAQLTAGCLHFPDGTYQCVAAGGSAFALNYGSVTMNNIDQNITSANVGIATMNFTLPSNAALRCAYSMPTCGLSTGANAVWTLLISQNGNNYAQEWTTGSSTQDAATGGTNATACGAGGYYGPHPPNITSLAAGATKVVWWVNTDGAELRMTNYTPTPAVKPTFFCEWWSTQ